VTGSDDEKPSAKKASAKKASAKKASAKKAAEADEADDEAEADEEPKTEEELNKLTIPKLKELCKSYELAQTGNKAALIERLVAKLAEAGDEEEAGDEGYTADALDKMTVKELKEICTGLELTFKAVAKKADLIKLILENQGGEEAGDEEAGDEEAGDEEAGDEEAEEEGYTADALDKMTVKELKEICTGLELTFKADLIKLILESQGGDEAEEAEE